MGGGTRLAIAILVLFLAMVAFFFAFHPGGVAAGTINNPPDLLKWMFGQYDGTVSGNSQVLNELASAKAPLTGDNGPILPGKTPGGNAAQRRATELTQAPQPGGG